MGSLPVETPSITGSSERILQTQLREEPACQERTALCRVVCLFPESSANHVLMAFLLLRTD